jgi:hypothetical protein
VPLCEPAFVEPNVRQADEASGEDGGERAWLVECSVNGIPRLLWY